MYTLVLTTSSAVIVSVLELQTEQNTSGQVSDASIQTVIVAVMMNHIQVTDLT